MKHIITIITCLACMCFGTQVFAQLTLYKDLDIKEAISFENNDSFGIKRTRNIGTIKVTVFTSENYTKEDDANSSSFLYGFKANQKLITEYQNISFGDYRWNIPPLAQPPGWSRSSATLRPSNDLNVFKNKLILIRDYREDFTTDNTVKVVIKVEMLDGAILSDIESIRIPGVTIARNNKNSERKIQVFRNHNNTPHIEMSIKDLNFNQLVVYEGDSVVFKTDMSSSYNKIEGLTDIAIARWAGESIFMTEEDISPGTHKPFLFFDSNVHGVKMRRYPEHWRKNEYNDMVKKKYPKWIESSNDAKQQTMYWIANRRRDYLITDDLVNDRTNVVLSAYKTAEEFSTTGFPNKNKFSGDNENLLIQRNNQREGLNVELLKAYFTQAKGVAGLDPDELFYANFNSSNILAAHPRTYIQDFKYVTKDSWKKIPKENKHINATLIKSINSIFAFIRPATPRERGYKGHEILDKNLFIHKNSTENIENAIFDYSVPQKMFNNKRPIVFNPLTSNKPLVHHRSKLTWLTSPGQGNDIEIAVLSPLEGRRKGVAYDGLTDDMRKNPQVNFYGIIEGPTFVAREQKNVKYHVQNLPDQRSVPGVFELVYTYEDANGFLDEIRKEVSRDSAFIEITFGGGGYHEITLQYKRNKEGNATPVIIAGKELIDVDLRFIFSPNAENGADFSFNPSETFGKGALKLNENKGTGKRWFLDDENPKMKEDDYGIIHGYKDHNVVRTYVLANNTNLTLSVLDADPHGFTHYQSDWYLSERRLSKRLTDKELKDPRGQHKIEWFASKDLNFHNKISLGFGRHQNISPDTIYNMTEGTFYVKAVYNDTNEIKVKFKIRNMHHDKNIGRVSLYPLSETQFDVFRKMAADMEITIKMDNALRKYGILAVEDLLSTYEYNKKYSEEIGSPRYIERLDGKEVGEHARFSPKNNFDARFDMNFISPNTGRKLRFTDVSFDFTNAKDPILSEWFPRNWIRHLDGIPQSPEIPTFNKVAYISPFDNYANPEITELNNNTGNLYEPWQVRLPWIAQTGLHGYKTRWNIKTIYDIEMLFARREFGKGYKKIGDNADDYHYQVDGTHGDKIIPNYTNDRREMQEFYWHLKTGRMVIIDKEILSHLGATEKLMVSVTNNEKGQKIGNYIYSGTVDLTKLQHYKTLNLKDSAISKTSFSIYPNPINDGRFSLEFVLREKGLASFEIFNIAGQLMFQKKNQNLDQGNHKIEFGKSDVNLASGVYLLKVVTNEYTETRKLFVE